MLDQSFPVHLHMGHMTQGFDVVERVNAAAARSGVTCWIDQFENVATHAMYRLPYVKTSAHVKRGDSVLDWGCGNGHFSFYLESLGARVTGYSYEPPPRSMERSSTFRFVPGIPDDPSRLPFADASFDVAVSMGVLEHVWETGGDERASLDELARVLKPGGTLLTFHFPNRTGVVEQVVKGLRLSRYVHGRRYGEADIRALWSASGFDVVDVGLYSALPRWQLRHLPASVRRSRSFAKAYDLIDDVIATAVPRVCTNYYAIARTPRA